MNERVAFAALKAPALARPKKCQAVKTSTLGRRASPRLGGITVGCNTPMPLVSVQKWLNIRGGVSPKPPSPVQTTP